MYRSCNFRNYNIFGNFKMNNNSIYFSDPVSLAQIQCHCGCGLNNINFKLLEILDRIRERLGRPINLNSVCRCEKHNKSKEVGGKPNSSHLKGLATDIRCNGYTYSNGDYISASLERFELLNLIFKEFPEITRIGIGKSFVHIDIDFEKPHRVVWVY